MVDMNYSHWGVNEFSGGMIDVVEDTMIQDNQCSDVQNCNCVTVGTLEKREGQSYLNTVTMGPASVFGLHAYYYGANLQNRRIFAVCNGTAFIWQSPNMNALKTGLSASYPTMFETCVNYLVAFDGVTPPWKFDGSSVTNLANAPIAKCPVLHKEKLFVILNYDTIVWSNSFNPEIWPSVNIWKFDVGDGDELSMIISYGRELLACKKRKIYSLQGTNLDDFRSDCVEKAHGVVGPRAGVVVDPYFYYISYDGIMRFNGVGSENLSESAIPKLWRTVNQAFIDKAVAGYNAKYNQIWFAVPEGASTVNNMILVYDLKFKSWWVHRNISTTCMLTFNTGTSLEFYTGTPNGYVVKQNTGYTDFGSPINSYWTGKNFDSGDPVRIKKFHKVYAVDVQGLNDSVFSYRINGGSWNSPSAFSDKNDVRRFNLISAKGRYFQPKFSHITAGNFTLSGFKTAFTQGLEK